MERTDANPPLEKSGPKGSWIVVIGTAGRYIGRTELGREDVDRIHGGGGVIKLEDIFEFTSQIQVGNTVDPRNPNQTVMQIGKFNLVYRLDAALFAVPVRLSLRGALLYWLDDLKEPDAHEYKELIQAALRMSEGWLRERTKSRSNLTLATEMPRAPVPGGR